MFKLLSTEVTKSDGDKLRASPTMSSNNPCWANTRRVWAEMFPMVDDARQISGYLEYAYTKTG